MRSYPFISHGEFLLFTEYVLVVCPLFLGRTEKPCELIKKNLCPGNVFCVDIIKHYTHILFQVI